MDLGTAVGFLFGMGIIFVGIFTSSGDPAAFYSWKALLIVIGGTLAATMVNYPLKNVLEIFSVLKNVFTSEKYDYQGMIESLTDKATKARKNGIMSLESDLSNIKEKFLRNGIELAINERDPNRLRTFLKLELNNIERRHSLGQEIFFYMGAYAPAFGMLGTVMGLIIMMNNFSGGGNGGSIDAVEFDVAAKFAELLAGMGLALITTFYGVLLANLVFLPIGGKLKRKSDEELMLKNIVVEGIISIHAKEHPILIREKLMTFVPGSLRKEEK